MYVDNIRTRKRVDTNAGFTIFELIIVIAIGVMLLAFTAPVGISFYQRILAEDATEELVLMLRTAENEARLGKNDIAHGVYVGDASLTHFQGVSYATRIASADHVVPLSPGTVIAGLPQGVVFGAHTGLPSATGTIMLTLFENTHTIEINTLGHIWDVTSSGGESL